MTEPPTINVSGLVKGGTYSGSVPVTISVSTGSCQVLGTSNHSSIYLKIGSNTGLLESASGDGNSLIYTWYTDSYPSGNINIEIVSYDINNNRSELNIPVIITSVSGSVPYVKPNYNYYDIEADTFGSSLEIFKQTNKSINIYPDSNLESLNSSTIMSAPVNSTIMVKFWLYRYSSSNTKGITVLRSTSQNGSYAEVGKTNYTITSNGYYFYFIADCSSALTPGQTYWYKIAYYNNYGNGTFSEPVSVRILPNYNLNLVSPANNSVVTGNSATLTWVNGAIADSTRYDWIEVRDILSNTVIYQTASNSPLTGSNSYTITSLQYNKQYVWDIVNSYYLYTNSSYVYSISFPSSGGNSSNGAYSFSTVNQ